MQRRSFLGCAAPAVLSAQRPQRNLVFILTDDHRFDMLGCLGHPWLKTPHLDRLARGGVLFENAFVTTSLCSPSRATILTGQYAHAHGVFDNTRPFAPGAVTFPSLLQRNGYRTGYIGKWHMGGGSDEAQPGFDRWVSFRGQGVYTDPEMNFDGVRRKMRGYMTDILTEESLRFIGESSARPFCLYLAHKGVHAEFVPADRHRDLYSGEAIPYPKSMANTERNYAGKPDWLRRARESCLGVDGMYNRRIGFDDAYRGYCRTLASVDDSVGRVLDTLAARGLLRDTLIVYMGDNGFLWGEHGLIDKRCMYEPSIRVPLIAHCPTLFAGARRVAEMALNIDIFPTLLDAAGIEPPPHVHGRSLLGPARGSVRDWRTEFLYEYAWERSFPQIPTVRGLRTQQYSYAQYHGVWDVDELYDIQADPAQMNNLLAGVRATCECTSAHSLIRDAGLKRLVSDLNRRREAILVATGG
jgi:N-acetylglucosamine-6-sulfatase